MMIFKSHFVKFIVLFFSLSLRAQVTLSELREKISGAALNEVVVESDELCACFNTYESIVRNEFKRDNVWIDQGPGEDFYNFEKFYPFMQKRAVGVSSKIIMWGDLHGAALSLAEGLNKLKEENCIDDQFNIICPDCYFVFLGDYVDRGDQSIELIYMIMRLKVANPKKVILLRGNHEDSVMNIDLLSELRDKYQERASGFEWIKRFYETLPCALTIGSGTKFIFCCHGGIEVGVNPERLVQSDGPIQYQLIDLVDRENNSFDGQLRKVIKTHLPLCALEAFIPQTPAWGNLGFLWSDFDVANKSMVSYEAGRGVTYGRRITRSYLEQMSSGEKKVKAIFRGHQHGEEMYDPLIENHGLVSHWNNLVYTLLASSEPLDDDVVFTSFVKIIMALDENWKIVHWYKNLSQGVDVSK